MSFAREGYPFAGASLLLAGVCWAGVWMGEGGGVLKGTAWILSAAAVFVLWFFRDPDPSLPSDADLVVAPGQGKIVAIQDVEEHTFMAGPARKISIFLSVFDVHVQRVPVSGTVEFQAYDPGKYVAAWLEKASDDNEQASLGIATEKGRVLVRQIAGLIARRIITDASKGDSVERGKRFGLIRFGSRVDLFVPMHWEVLCAVGDKVRVGTTVIARQMEEPT
ncbi:MAG: phosphatidylserine decarboxylase family protein [Gemmatimonadetes bacterium]|nr:phosphatidylserine decarboxylase family protein [Gemmatimonadota bacterium]